MPAEDLPTPGFFVDNDTINLFKESMDQLIADMGQKFTLFLDPIKTNCPNCGFDARRGKSNNVYTTSPAGPKRFKDGRICPWCKGKGQLFVEQTIQYTGILDPTKKGVDKALEDLGMSATENAIRTITVFESFQEIKDASSASIRGEQFKLLAGPVILGLRDDQFVDTIWQKIPRK